MKQIRRGIYYEDSYQGVTLGALVFSHGIIMIDAPLRSEDARSWRMMLNNQRGGTNRLLVSLDAHPDRTLGARAMECTIIAHQKTAQVFRNRPNIFKGQSSESGAAWETYSEILGTRWAAPDLAFSDRMALYWGGPQVFLEHHPGPTAGSVWVIAPDESVIFVGDTVTPRQPPFLASAELPAWIESLDLLASRFGSSTILSGRAGLVEPADIKTQRALLVDIQARLDALAADNAPPEATENLAPDIMKQIGFPQDRYEQYIQRLTYGLYQCYTRRIQPGSVVEPPPIEEPEE